MDEIIYYLPIINCGGNQEMEKHDNFNDGNAYTSHGIIGTTLPHLPKEPKRRIAKLRPMQDQLHFMQKLQEQVSRNGLFLTLS